MILNAPLLPEKMCVIIPVHKPDFSEDEALSLSACYRCLKEYDTFLVYPKEMDISKYLLFHSALLLKPVNPIWLSSIENYNIMKADMSFYELFTDYDFMLTYELDAYIFNADFQKHNFLNFDYIGAPFFEGYLNALPNAPFVNGGNSGFSIRNIKSCIEALSAMNRYRYHWLFYKYILSKFHRFRFHLNRLTNGKYDVYINGKLSFYFDRHHLNEDLVWSQVVPFLFPDFKVADPLTAAKFSFEANPEKLLLMTNGELPLGCHGWPKNKNFWKKYIPTP